MFSCLPAPPPPPQNAPNGCTGANQHPKKHPLADREVVEGGGDLQTANSQLTLWPHNWTAVGGGGGATVGGWRGGKHNGRTAFLNKEEHKRAPRGIPQG